MVRNDTFEIEVGVEDIEPDHWIAWVFDIPGCYSSASTERDAVSGIPDAYLAETHEGHPVTVAVRERLRAVPADDDPGFLINACFEDDRRPLLAEDVKAGINRLGSNRDRLMSLLTGRAHDDEVERVLAHMATAEEWYLTQLDLAPERPSEIVDPLVRLQWARGVLLEVLPRLVDRPLEVTHRESWTPRKLLRRAIWHERDHTLQIEQYFKGF